MMKRMHRTVAAALCGIALGVAALSPVHAAGQTVLQGQSDQNTYALVWMDTSNGTSLDDKTAQSTEAQFSNTTWILQDNQNLTISQNGKALLTTFWVSNKDMTYIPLHSRSGNTTVDGTIYRDSKDPAQGFAVIFINQVGSNGQSSRCLRVEANLTFGSASGGNGNGNGGGGSSFGSF
jgi:hypothetical protein